MAILGIGADIVQTPRILALIQRIGPQKLARRILSEVELGHWDASRSGYDIRPSDAQFLAVRWAMKEAAYKAVYPTFRPTWKDLTYYPLGAMAPGSKPSLFFKYQPALALHCSVSHDGDYVFATVVAEK
ncbi:4'-phosphopantetheinyl transferase [Lentinula aciculospora]|uniref:4'-phosphopantetheinyl transferase n=1 Tax=Lentinula aciculospora TaxID=153920 RepID=A0A9W8ZTM2_9AGAR|nr:4'-phosphopantetheinyl transferase [Lentinula aciculospora]